MVWIYVFQCLPKGAQVKTIKNCMVISIVGENTALFILPKYSKHSRMYMYYFYNQEKKPLCLKLKRLVEAWRLDVRISFHWHAQTSRITCVLVWPHPHWKPRHFSNECWHKATSSSFTLNSISLKNTVSQRHTLIPTTLTNERSPVRFDLSTHLTGKKRTLVQQMSSKGLEF